MTEDTILTLSGVGVPLWSARGLRQSLTPIAQSVQPRRTVNGTLVDLSNALFYKYASTISCSDMRPPAVDGKWPGQVVVVDCVQELCVEANTDSETEDLGRESVPGSVREENGFVFYRPRLTMMVVGMEMETDEWGQVVAWSMSLEEV